MKMRLISKEKENLVVGISSRNGLIFLFNWFSELKNRNVFDNHI